MIGRGCLLGLLSPVLQDSAGAATSFLRGSVGGDGIKHGTTEFYNSMRICRADIPTGSTWRALKGEHEFSWARFTSISGYNYLRSVDLIDLDARNRSAFPS